MKTKIANWGNSLGVRLPKSITRKLNLKSGTMVRLDSDSYMVKIKPISQKNINLKDLVSHIHPDNIHQLEFTDSSQGREVW